MNLLPGHENPTDKENRESSRQDQKNKLWSSCSLPAGGEPSGVSDLRINSRNSECAIIPGTYKVDDSLAPCIYEIWAKWEDDDVDSRIPIPWNGCRGTPRDGGHGGLVPPVCPESERSGVKKHGKGAMQSRSWGLSLWSSEATPIFHYATVQSWLCWPISWG